MSGTSLVCVGLSEPDALPPDIQALFDTGLFEEFFRAPTPLGRRDRYWCSVVEGLSDDVDIALVITADAGVTPEILRLGKLMDDWIAVALPLSLQHKIARPLITPQEEMSLSSADLNHWLNRYAVGKPLEVPLLAGFCGWVSAKV